MSKKQKKNLMKLMIIIAIMAINFYINANRDAQNVVKPVTGTVEVHFIDVGQGDSMLIREGEKAMLIDGGPREASESLVKYLKSLGIVSIDYVIGTHPHEDHIGGLTAVFNEFEIKNVMMPKVSHTTKTFRDLTAAIKNEGLKVKTPIVGDIIALNEAEFLILSPEDKDYESLNDYSIVMKMTYGETSFLFTGDAESLIEETLLSKHADIKADILKLPHHGSSTSNTYEFLRRVNPTFAVIEVGFDNSYGHPHKEVVERLNDLNIPYYMTMDLGNIVVVSDGVTITRFPN